MTPRSSRCSKATGIRLAELTGLRYDPDDPRRSDIDLRRREITVCGKDRIVRIGHQTARSLDRYIPARPRPGSRSCGWA